MLLLFGVGAAMAQKPVLHRKHVVHRRAVVPTKPAEPLYAVSTGTVMRARLNRTINSRYARVGDTFTATVTEPVYSSNGVVVVPIGSTVTGRIDMVRPAANGGKPGEIDARFTRLHLPNGRSRAINGSLTDLVAGNVKSDNEGTVSGKKMEHRTPIYTGGGAVGGAILGGAIGGGKGALIGAILGGGGGYLADKNTRGKEAEVLSGTEFGIYLNQGISLPRFGEITPTRP